MKQLHYYYFIINITVDIHKKMYTLGQGPVTESLHKQYILMILLLHYSNMSN